MKQFSTAEIRKLVWVFAIGAFFAVQLPCLKALPLPGDPDYYAGKLPYLEVVQTNRQMFTTNNYTVLSLAIEATKTNGTVLVNAPLRFAVTNGTLKFTNTNGVLSTNAILKTAGNGNAGTWLYVPDTNASYLTVTATSGTNSRQLHFKVQLTGAGGTMYSVQTSTNDLPLPFAVVAKIEQLNYDDVPHAPPPNYNPPPVDHGTNLWLEITTITNDGVHVTLHNTTNGFFYQLLSKTNLAQPEWNLGALVDNSDGGTNISITNFPVAKPAKFYWAEQADEFFWVTANGPAREPASDSASDGVDGQFTIHVGNMQDADPDKVLADTTVYYRLSGTATNDTNYDFLAGQVTILAGECCTSVVIHPKWVNDFDYDQTVTLILIRTNAYLIDPDQASATILIQNAPFVDTNAFQVVTNDLNHPTGIDFHPVNNSLIVSTKGYGIDGNNFIQIFTNGSSTNLLVSTWSDVTNLPIVEMQNELYFTIVQTNAGGFTVGWTYFSNGQFGEIGGISSGGTNFSTNWTTLSNVNNSRLSLCMDQTGVFGYNLMVVSPEGPESAVWLLTASSNAVPTNDLPFVTIQESGLEGVISIPNTSFYGPWAGKILTGAEAAGLIYVINADGVVTSTNLGIHPESFAIIPTDQDLYCLDSGSDTTNDGRLLKMPRNYFSNNIGDLLMAQEDTSGSGSPSSTLFIVHWDAATTNFIKKQISFDGTFEQVKFAPVHLPTQ